MTCGFNRSLTAFFVIGMAVLFLKGDIVFADGREKIQRHKTHTSFSLRAKSQTGRYWVTLLGLTEQPPFNKMHHWHVKLVSQNGRAISKATIKVAANMVDQTHTLPTSPRITNASVPGEYIIEGVKFDRQGDWRLTLSIRSKYGTDDVSFKLPVGTVVWADLNDGWTEDELKILKSLWIGSLPKPPHDPTNAVADNKAAANFGHHLFFDSRLSKDGSVACANCHIPDLAFTDGRKMVVGLGQTKRNAPTIIGVTYSPWLFWDGRKDSLWSQALGPLEHPLEHGTTRKDVVKVILKDPSYRQRYQTLFGGLPNLADPAEINRAFINLGKVIAAYERQILPAPTKFDRYVKALLSKKKPAPEDQFSLNEIAGLKVFISDNQGQCIRCHNGPLMTDHSFHNIGSHIVGDNAGEMGRSAGLKLAQADTTNCHSKFSDDSKAACAELNFAKHNAPETVGAFKTPTLRYVSRTAPYMHAGQFQNLEDVIWQYRDVPPATVGQSELQNLIMTDSQFRQIEDFLRTLDGPIHAPQEYLHPPD
jgi:cytochrome c peroxidase